MGVTFFSWLAAAFLELLFLGVPGVFPAIKLIYSW